MAGQTRRSPHAEQAYLDFRKANPQLKKSRQELAHFGQLLADHARGPAAFPKISDMTADHRAIYRDGVTGLYVVVCHPYGGGHWEIRAVKDANECQLRRWEPKLARRIYRDSLPDRLFR